MRICLPGFEKARKHCLTDFINRLAFDETVGSKVKVSKATPEELAELDRKLGKVEKGRKVKKPMRTFSETFKETGHRHNVKNKEGRVIGFLTPAGFIRTPEPGEQKECAACSSLEHVAEYELNDGGRIHLCRKCAGNPVWRGYVRKVDAHGFGKIHS